MAPGQETDSIETEDLVADSGLAINNENSTPLRHGGPSDSSAEVSAFFGTPVARAALTAVRESAGAEAMTAVALAMAAALQPTPARETSREGFDSPSGGAARDGRSSGQPLVNRMMAAGEVVSQPELTEAPPALTDSDSDGDSDSDTDRQSNLGDSDGQQEQRADFAEAERVAAEAEAVAQERAKRRKQKRVRADAGRSAEAEGLIAERAEIAAGLQELRNLRAELTADRLEQESALGDLLDSLRRREAALLADAGGPVDSQQVIAVDTLVGTKVAPQTVLRAAIRKAAAARGTGTAGAARPPGLERKSSRRSSGSPPSAGDNSDVSEVDVYGGDPPGGGRGSSYFDAGGEHKVGIEREGKVADDFVRTFARVVKLRAASEFSGEADDFDVSEKSANENFEWLLTALHYSNQVARQMRLPELPDWAKILLVTSLFTGAAEEWYRSLVYRQQMASTAHGPDFILTEAGVGDVMESLASFEAAFVQRWTPARFTRQVREAFEKLAVADGQLSSIRSFASSFDMMLAKLRVLKVTYDEEALSSRLESALIKAPSLLFYLRTHEVMVKTKGGGERQRVRCDQCYAGVVDGIRTYLSVAPVRQPSAWKGGGRDPRIPGRLNVMGDAIHELGEYEEPWSEDEPTESEAPLGSFMSMATHTALESEAAEVDRLEQVGDDLRAAGTDEALVGRVMAMTEERRSALVCYNCKETGHIGRFCEKKRTAEYTAFLEKAAADRATEKQQRLSGGRPAGTRPTVPGRGHGSK